MEKKVKIALYIICALLLVVSGWKIFDIVSEYAKSKAAYHSTADSVISTTKVGTESGSDMMKPPIEVDFEALKAEGDNIIGWLYCEDTEINYPVVQGEDNFYYVRRLPDGTYNKAGSIFMDFRCSTDFENRNTIIYGHNMKNGSMFATLKKYGEQSFYDEHPRMWYFTPDKTYTLELFAGYVTSTGTASFDLFNNREELGEYLSDSEKKSTFVPTVSAGDIERVVTMVTCSYEYDTARYVLIGSVVPYAEEVTKSDI